MPIKECQIGGKSGYKWGDEGKCYPGESGKKKAIAQGVAIEGGFAIKKASFDYDETLTKPSVMEKAKNLIASGVLVYIISARRSAEPMLSRAEELGIPKSRVYATGSNKAKVEKIVALDIDEHHDNNQDVIDALKDTNTKGIKE